jgi:hypothetical protein
VVAARLTLEWPGGIILFPKTFIPLASTLTASVTVDGFEMDVTHSAVQAKCLPSYQLASSLLHQHQQVVWSLQYFSGLAVHLHRHQPMPALVKLTALQILLQKLTEIIGSCTLLITCLQKNAGNQRYRIQQDPLPTSHYTPLHVR